MPQLVNCVLIKKALSEARCFKQFTIDTITTQPPVEIDPLYRQSLFRL